MKQILKLEQLAIFLLSILLFLEINIVWWWFPLLLLLPDISMIGYGINNRIGANLYNIFHHQGIAILIYGGGSLTGESYIMAVGVILLGHSAMDRIFGYGLKYFTSFHHTHLGRIDEK